MKKSKISLWITEFLIFALLNLIVFLTVPDGRTETGTFWLAWTFAIPLNFFAIIGFTFWGFKDNAMEIVHPPIALYLSYIFAAIYVAIGIIFMYFNITGMTFLVILEAIVTVAYVISAIYFVLGTDYIAKNQKYTKSKVIYIRLLEANINDCIPKAQNPACVAGLRRLAENVRFSDPMSHDSLSGVEVEISTTVNSISIALSEDPMADVTALINRADAQLKSRNDLCRLLK